MNQATPAHKSGNDGLPTTFDDFSLQAAMVYDTNDRKRQAAELAKQQIQQLSPLAGKLGNEVTELVKNGGLAHDDKVARLNKMRAIATGQPLAKLYGMNHLNALEVLQASAEVPDSTKLGLERAFLPEDDPLHIGFDDEGTPEEVLRGRDRIVELEDKLDNFVHYTDGPVRELFVKFAAVLGLAPIDNEITDDLRERIQVALDNGAQPVNLVPAPQQPPAPVPPGTTPPTAPTTGSNPQPAPAPTGGPQPPAPPASGNPPAAPQGRLAKVAQALKGK